MNKWFSCILFVTFMLGCEEIEVSSEIPEIEFISYNYPDSTLKFSLLDGDGDIGLKQGDTADPYVDKYYYNFYFYLLEKNDTGYAEVEFAEPLHSRINYIEQKQGQNKTLKADIEVHVREYGITELPDTFKFEFYIIDRALHESNVVRTPVLSYETHKFLY